MTGNPKIDKAIAQAVRTLTSIPGVQNPQDPANKNLRVAATRGAQASKAQAAAKAGKTARAQSAKYRGSQSRRSKKK